MVKVQEKLQECVDKGSLNSFERLSKIFGGDDNNNDMDMEDSGKNKTINDDSPMKIISSLQGKNPDKVPRGKKDIMKKSKIRGQKKGQKVSLRSSSKKKISS